ncbi:MAG: hypothetical protein LH614_16000 [Pyrinomonadaceae bacterium]|nr:hypothetical protein [Pyrinomonadaceae bacterium]
MKLRIRGNSLRLRLLRGEVEQFGKTGNVTETIRFGTSNAAQLSYILKADDQAEQIFTYYTDNQITVTIPAKTAKNWVESDEVSLKSEQTIEDDSGKNGNSKNVLKILIEKDFVCLDRKNDPDNVDAFPHPTGKCA